MSLPCTDYSDPPVALLGQPCASGPNPCQPDNSACAKRNDKWVCVCDNGYLNTSNNLCEPGMTSLFTGDKILTADVYWEQNEVYTFTINVDYDIPLTLSSLYGDTDYWDAAIALLLSRKRRDTHGQFEWEISISPKMQLPNDITSYFLVISVEASLNDFHITDTIGLRLNVLDAISCTSVLNPKIINEVVIDGTRAGTVIADLEYLVLYHSASQLQMQPLAQPQATYLNIDSKGILTASQDIRVAGLTGSGQDAVSSFSFNIKGNVNGESVSRILATVKLTVMKDQLNMQVSESLRIDSKLASFGNNSVTITGLPSNFELRENELRLINPGLDYEGGTTEYSFSVTIDTGAKVINIPVFIHVSDYNDNPPTFIDPSISLLTFENAPSGSVVGIIETEDKDVSSVVIYQLTTHTSRFSIDSVGAVIAKTPINKNGSVNDVLSLGITISDGVYSASIVVQLEVVTLDPNQGNLGQVFTGNVLENEDPGTFVAIVRNASYTDFRFVGSSRNTAKFILNSTTGEIFTTEELDREEEASYRFSIRGVLKDDFVCSITIIGDITINVGDVNDNPPVFSGSGYTGSVLEESDAGTTVTMVPLATTDKDEGVNAQSTFSIISGDNGMFEIGLETGIITTRNKPDRETTASYTLVVQATDNGAVQLSATSTVVISILDINDHAPVVTSVFRTISVLENITADEVIGTITATDDDDGANGEIYFSIFSVSGGHYGINVDNGELRATGVLDRESSDTNRLSIAITDKGNPPLNTTLTIVITLLDVNDNDPTFVDQEQNDVFMYEFTASENSNIGDVIGNVSATDPDDGANGDVEYFIASSESPVSVSSTSGQLTLSTLLDYETRTSHSITVRATDKGQTRRTTEIDVFLNVKDYNDNGPVFTSDEYTVNFVKTSNNGSALVTAIEVREDDTGINGQIILNITNNDNFEISQQGVISVVSVERLEVETVNLTVRATDRGDPPQTATTHVIVTISLGTDASNLINSVITFDVMENTSFSSALHTIEYLSATIPSYEIVVDNYNGLFTIDSSTGELFLKSGETLDRETKDQYLLVIQARQDSNDVSDLALVFINVLDTNDNAPEFPNPGATLMMEVLENAPNGTVVGVVLATDRDTGDNGRIEYSLTDLGGFPFAIDSDGSVYVTGEVDRESRSQNDYLYSFTVKVEDYGDSRLSGTKSVQVHVFDMNDNTPEFTEASPVILPLKEDAPRAQVTAFTVTDADNGINGTVVFSILPTSPPCPLSIIQSESGVIMQSNKECVLILSGDLDYELKKFHTCVLVASDMASEGNRLSSTIHITIEVGDSNDNSPQFLGSYDDVNISRQVEIGNTILQINATDEDSGRNKEITFTLNNESPYAEYFSIDPFTGWLRLDQSLIELQKDNITLLVIATDGGDPQLSTEILVKINIHDKNTRPFFQVSNYGFKIVEEDPPSSLGFIEARDIVGGKNRPCNCTYSQDDSTVFTIDRRGFISFTKNERIDREVTGSIISFTVTATDEELQSGTIKVNVIVSDINDNGPVLASDSYEFFIEQNMTLGSKVTQIVATDADIEGNAITEFYLESLEQQPWFRINSTTGEIFVNRPLTVAEGIEAIDVVMTLKAVDAALPAFTNVALIIFHISYRDPNPNAPVWLKDVYNIEVERDHSQDIPIPIDDFGAADIESTQLIYSIRDGNIMDLFRINPDTGSLYLKYSVLDAVSNVTLIVTATDRALKPKESSCKVNITFTGASRYIETVKADALVAPWRTATIILVVFCILFVAVFIIILILKMVRRSKKEQSPEACGRNFEPAPDYLTASVGHHELRRTEYTKPTHSGEDFQNPGYASLQRRDPLARQAEDINLIDRDNMLLHGLSSSQVDNNTWT